jgi:hypothetical protein
VNPEVLATLVGLLSMILVVIIFYVIWLVIESNR